MQLQQHYYVKRCRLYFFWVHLIYLLTTRILKTINFLSGLFYSRYITAKNAWGTNTGYADTLIEQGVDTSRAQQLENWWDNMYPFILFYIIILGILRYRLHIMNDVWMFSTFTFLVHSLTHSQSLITNNHLCTISPVNYYLFIRHNQQEVLQKRKAQRSLTEDFDSVESSEDENWRNLASFGVERNQVSKMNMNVCVCVLMGE